MSDPTRVRSRPLAFADLVRWLLVVCLISSTAMAQFTDGDLFVSSSVTDEVRIYDSSTLTFKSSFTHPEFQKNGSPAYAYGPSGMAFNSRGHLVVSARESLVEFSAPGVEYAVHPKAVIEPNENIVFDKLGNLYTTTSTYGSDLLNQYLAPSYVFAQTILLPPSAGELTGIAIDSQDRLFVASQSDDKVHVLQADSSFTVFTLIDFIDSSSPGYLEGLRISRNGELLVADGNVTRYDPDTGVVLGSFGATNLYWPVPITTDNQGFIYVSDYENGYGTLPADLFRFSPDGSTHITINDPSLMGPFGLVVAGTHPTPGSGYCFGDSGSGTPCPCSNDNDGSFPGSGCANGAFSSGAQLTGSGYANVFNDTLVLTTTHLEPNNAGLYFQADNDLSPGTPWGDGLQCAGGNLRRLQVRFADATGTSSTTIGISAKAGNVSPGDTKYYQCWYRTIVNPPCGLGVNDFNSSNGYVITW